MKKFLIIVLAVLLSFTACTNRTPIWILPPGAFYPEKEPEPDPTEVELNLDELVATTLNSKDNEFLEVTYSEENPSIATVLSYRTAGEPKTIYALAEYLPGFTYDGGSLIGEMLFSFIVGSDDGNIISCRILSSSLDVTRNGYDYTIEDINITAGVSGVTGTITGSGNNWTASYTSVEVSVKYPAITIDGETVKPDGECNHAELINVTEWFDNENHYPEAGTCAWCGEEIKRETIEIGTAEDLVQLGEDLSEFYDIGCYTISITDDIDMTDRDWPTIILDGYNAEHYNNKSFIINGNGHAIKNITIDDSTAASGLGFISKMWSAVTLEINNLILMNATVTATIGNDDGPGVGGFVGVIDSSASVKFNDCHVIDSTISGGHWAGGIYGYASGWSRKDDGPVATYIEISDCSVEGTTISSSDASTGGVMGHAGGDKDTFITVKNTNVNNCTITSTENGTVIKAGHVMGTNGVGQTTLEKVTFDNNTVTSDDTPVSREYGRLAFAGAGSLTIDGKKITES